MCDYKLIIIITPWLNELKYVLILLLFFFYYNQRFYECLDNPPTRCVYKHNVRLQVRKHLAHDTHHCNVY